MNSITLIGSLYTPPTYYCTRDGRDLTRFQIHDDGVNGEPATGVFHHCQAWGPAALDLHEHLTEGERLLVRGELRYRLRTDGVGATQVPYIHVKAYSYLG